MNQSLPPSLDQQLADARTAGGAAQALVKDLEAIINAATTALDTAGAPRDLPMAGRVAALSAENDRLRAEATALANDLGHAQFERDQADRDYSDMTATIAQLRADLSSLLLLVGAETPIAAFDLATTWRAEKAGYMEEIAAQAATIAGLRKALEDCA